MVEKRLSNHECVPTKTFFWHHDAFKRLFTMEDHFHRTLEPIIPIDRDSFIAPRDENGRPADYVYHVYTTVKNHALSLQLCEAIEKVNHLLQLSSQTQCNPARSSYGNSKRVQTGSILPFNLFTPSSPPAPPWKYNCRAVTDVKNFFQKV